MVEAETLKPTEISCISQTQLTGAADEAMAQVHLLMRGWVAGNINASVRNNAGNIASNFVHKWQIYEDVCHTL